MFIAKALDTPDGSPSACGGSQAPPPPPRSRRTCPGISCPKGAATAPEPHAGQHALDPAMTHARKRNAEIDEEQPGRIRASQAVQGGRLQQDNRPPSCSPGTSPTHADEQHFQAAWRNTTLANDAINLLSVLGRLTGRRSPAAAATSPSPMTTAPPPGHPRGTKPIWRTHSCGCAMATSGNAFRAIGLAPR